ncbi:MAG: NfeD family protein [Bacteroidetes bacterium]|nr:NfeD family protein [Bacteroidota bacterium]
MSIFFISVLILFGILLIVLEILIVPGFIVGIAGAVFVVMGIGWTWQVYGSTAGIIVALISIFVTGLSIWSALRTSFWKKFSLRDKLEGRMNVIDESRVKAGDRGEAVSSLRPMGTVRVNGERYEAATEGRMVPPNYPIIVIRVEGNKLIVKPNE